MPPLLAKIPLILSIAWSFLGLSAFFFNIPALKTFIALLFGLLPVLFYVASSNRTVRGYFYVLNTFFGWFQWVPFDALDYILRNGKQGDPTSIVKAFDEYCWNHCMMMNLGDTKGQIVDKVLQSTKPKVCVELGSHCGYSTIRFASHLKPGQILHSVDPDPLGHAVSAKLIQFANVSDRVKPYYGFSGDALRTFAREKITIDFLFLDHVKDLYLSDLQLAISLGLLKPGSVVVADNILMPGAPEYKAWILKQSNFKSEVHSSWLEYSHNVKDELLVSTYLG